MLSILNLFFLKIGKKISSIQSNHSFCFLFRYLKEKMNELIQEKNHALANATKYKVYETFSSELNKKFLS